MRNAESTEYLCDVWAAQNVLAEKVAEARVIIEKMANDPKGARGLFGAALNGVVAEFFHELPRTHYNVAITHLVELLNPDEAVKYAVEKAKRARLSLLEAPQWPK